MSARNTTNYLELLWRALRARLGGTASPSCPLRPSGQHTMRNGICLC